MRFLSRIWKRSPSLNDIPSWKKAKDDEQKAIKRGCTQDVNRARQRMREAINESLRNATRNA